MLINQLNKLFIYVAYGSGKEWIENYSQKDEYKQKIAFVADTKEIWTNGKGFGTSYTEFQQLMNLVNSNKAELDAKIAEIEAGQSADVTQLIGRLDTIDSSINILTGDENTEGSVAHAIKALQDLILGADPETLIEAFDTIKEISEWIEQTGIENLQKLDENLTDVSNRLAAEIARSTEIDNDHETRITNIEEVDVWDLYETDSVPETPDTVHASSADVFANITDPENTDVVADNQDAVDYFADPANSNVTYQNITIG